jgi:sulfite reductase beta subunit-like hemoprotein
MSAVEAIRFPCEALPEEAAQARLLGVYPQRQEGLFMQRVKVPGGRIEAGQLRALAAIAERCNPDYPLHLTTRQTLEFHGLRREDIPGVQREIQSAGFTGLGACGDTLRNVTVCPGAGRCSGGCDVSALGDAIARRAGALPWIQQLPRKFKISLSGCPNACARPWINDIGLIAQADGTIRAIVAGSLGARPATGIPFDGTLSAQTAPPFALAALRLFLAEGDRTNRTRARLRHVRERMGDAAFLRRLDALFQEELRSGAGPEPEWKPAGARVKRVCRLHPPLGDLTLAQARELDDAVAAAGADLRIGFQHDLLVYGQTSPALTPSLQPMTAAPTLVSCPGTAWCSRGIADSRGLAASLHAAWPAGCALGVAISGCPNNCSHAAVADIGLVGRIKSVNGARQECYRVFAGGGGGKTGDLAAELHPCVPTAQVPETVRWLAGEYAKTSGERGETFGAFVAREKARLSAAMAASLPAGE